jgi:osmotically-inducible protein OsmY
VTLFGEVIRPTTKSEAESRVEDVAGVSRVVNNIQVLPLSSFDDSIRVNTLRELANTGALYRYFWEPSPAVRIIVNRGHVSLEGSVAHRGDYNLMNIIARTVPGAFSVKNNLIIEKETNR